MRSADTWQRQTPRTGLCINAFSETDFTEDLKETSAPTQILLGDDDQIVPIANSALLSAEVGKKIGPAGSSRAHPAGWLKSCATKSTPIFSPPFDTSFWRPQWPIPCSKFSPRRNCKVIFIDRQPQMAFGVQSIDRQTLKHNTVALAKAARVFKISSRRMWSS
jgi:fermentation-respiration switch protein FrsA (DUF1100 family)